MLRTFITFTLTLGALVLATTSRGLGLLGSNRPALVLALGVLGMVQAYRLFSAWQKRKRDDRFKDVPRRPLGI